MKIQTRDIIGFGTVGYGLYLIGQGINSIVSGIVIMVVTYYFSKRIFEETNGKR